jgi:hypothetical protein
MIELFGWGLCDPHTFSTHSLLTFILSILHSPIQARSDEEAKANKGQYSGTGRFPPHIGRIVQQMLPSSVNV